MFRIVTETLVIDFDTLEEAKQFAERYFKSFGVVLGIEEVEDNG